RFTGGSARASTGESTNTPTPIQDYGANGFPGDVTFAPGQTVAVVPVLVYGDNVVEGDESVVLAGEVVRGAARVTSVGTGTILNDDGTKTSAYPVLRDGVPLITSGPGAALENGVPGSSSGNVIHIPVRLSFPAKTAQVVPLIWRNGSAVARPPDGSGTDFWIPRVTPGQGGDTLVFKPGETLRVISVQIYPDEDIEPDESFSVEAGGAAGTGTILNDDPSPSPQQVAQHDQIIQSLYQGGDATGYQFDTDGNGTWETQCDGTSAIVQYPAAAEISDGVARILSKLGISQPATTRAAGGTPATYTYGARAVGLSDAGETVQLGHVTSTSVAATHVTVDTAYVLARLAEARQRLRARLQELRHDQRTVKARGLTASIAQTAVPSPYQAALQKEIQKQIDVLLKASATVNHPGPASATVTAAIKAVTESQATAAITAACTKAQLEVCPTTVIYKFVEMVFPSDAPAGSCYRRVAATTPSSRNLAAATSLQYRSPLNVPILVNGLRLQNGSLPVVDEKVDEKISHVRFVLDTGNNTLASVSETTGLPPFAGIYGEIKPASATMGSRYILQTDLINWPVDRASKVTDASALKKAIANLPTNTQKLNWITKYGAGVKVGMSLGGLALNGIDEVHLLRKRSAAFGSFMLPTLARPTDKELADPTRKKGALELLQGVTVQTVFAIDNTAGIVFDGLNAKVGEIPAGNLFKIKDLSLSYVKSSDEWNGSLELYFPPTGAYGAKGSFTIRGGKFVGLSAAALFDPGIQLGCCVRLTKVGGSYANTYWDANGCLQSPATCSKYKSDHADTLPPNLCLTDPTRKQCETSVQVAGLVGLAAGPKVKVGTQTKDLLNVDGSLKFVDSTANNPWALTANADFSLLGELSFGHAVITYINGQQFSGYGTVNKTFAAACLELNINAMLGVDIYSATKWQAFAGVGIGGNLCGVASFAFKQEILASSRGIGACANVTAAGLTYGAGVVYTWNDRGLHSFSGCSHDQLVTEGGVTARRSIRATGAPRTVTVPAGVPTFLFKLTGATKPPDVVLTAPDGTTVDTSAAAGRRGYLVYPGVDHETYIDVKDPAPGSWTVDVKDGSSPVIGLETANGIADPSVQATVGGEGRARVVQFKVRSIPGQRVRFAERLAGHGGAPGPAQIIGETSAASGGLRFVPATGPAGRRTIEATVLQHGQPRAVFKVAHYMAPGPFKPGVPTMKLRRRGSRLIVTWKPVLGAQRYRVLARVTAFDNHVLRLVGHSVFATRGRNQRRVVIPNVSRRERVGLSVTAVSSAGFLGGTAHRSAGG
ncbi:MAG: domain containing protein, partial [Solirubrobacterales bacterium]|nr:domain containing protein [Solirubrobacterales bacterium]